jgi:uncharacterized protein involved in tellurium resistance
MSFVLKHKETGEIFSCTLKNIYDFEYHGVKVWDDADAAGAELGAVTAEQGDDQPWTWEVAELDEAKVKMCNVKLNNNPAKRIYMTAEGKLEARTDR